MNIKMQCYGCWQFPFCNYPLVCEFYQRLNLKNLKVYFLVEGTFVIPYKDENESLYPTSRIDPKYLVRLINANEADKYDIIVGFNEIDYLNIKSLGDEHPFHNYLKKFVYVPAIPIGIYKRSTPNMNGRDIDVLTLFTNESVYGNRIRRRLFLPNLTNLNHVNLSGITSPEIMLSYFARAKIILHVSQSDYHWNTSEISLLPALCHGAIPISEKCGLFDQFAYSRYIVWCDYDNIITTINNVLTNYSEYFNKIQNTDLDKTLEDMIDKSYNQFKTILNCDPTCANPHL